MATSVWSTLDAPCPTPASISFAVAMAIRLVTADSLRVGNGATEACHMGRELKVSTVRIVDNRRPFTRISDQKRGCVVCGPRLHGNLKATFCLSFISRIPFVLGTFQVVCVHNYA